MMRKVHVCESCMPLGSDVLILNSGLAKTPDVSVFPMACKCNCCLTEGTLANVCAGTQRHPRQKALLMQCLEHSVTPLYM
jgi:hypothetical protein